MSSVKYGLFSEGETPSISGDRKVSKKEDGAGSTRVNLAVSTSDMIRIEKECDKRGLTRAQFIKEAIHEKLRGLESKDEESELKKISESLDELRKIVLLLVERER